MGYLVRISQSNESRRLRGLSVKHLGAFAQRGGWCYFLGIFALLPLACPLRAVPIVDFTFDASSSWGNGYTSSASVSVSNAGDTAVEDWSISFSLAAEITAFWEANKISESFENDLWNYTFAGIRNDGVLAADSSVSFGFNAAPISSATAPIDVYVEGASFLSERLDPEVIPDEEAENPPAPQYSISYTVPDDWEGGANINVTITNTGDVAWADWVVGFELDREILNFWNGNLTEGDSENRYAISYPDWNRVLDPGESAVVGLQIGPGSGYLRDLRLDEVNGEPVVSPVPEAQHFSLLLGGVALLTLCRRYLRRRL